MAQVEIEVAKTDLAELLERAQAGEDIIVARNGRPVARLVPIAGTNTLAALHGALRGRVHFAEDFQELPDDIGKAFALRGRSPSSARWATSSTASS
jgi:prevent-host-death family protein